MLTISSAILPAVVASAASSNRLMVSKNFSTLAAVLVPRPKSNRLAPNEKAPSGILNTPDAIPDKVDLITPISSSSSYFFLFGDGSAKFSSPSLGIIYTP